MWCSLSQLTVWRAKNTVLKNKKTERKKKNKGEIKEKNSLYFALSTLMFIEHLIKPFRSQFLHDLFHRISVIGHPAESSQRDIRAVLFL